MRYVPFLFLVGCVALPPPEATRMEFGARATSPGIVNALRRLDEMGWAVEYTRYVISPGKG